MAELLCEENCTKHYVQLDTDDRKMLSNFVVDYTLASAFYDETTKDIVIRLKVVDDV
tara:strand:- start:527 stop:697 length:171 start_codon:yes stop_codon:yes gene_type:complete